MLNFGKLPKIHETLHFKRNFFFKEKPIVIFISNLQIKLRNTILGKCLQTIFFPKLFF